MTDKVTETYLDKFAEMLQVALDGRAGQHNELATKFCALINEAKVSPETAIVACAVTLGQIMGSTSAARDRHKLMLKDINRFALEQAGEVSKAFRSMPKFSQ